MPGARYLYLGSNVVSLAVASSNRAHSLPRPNSQLVSCHCPHIRSNRNPPSPGFVVCSQFTPRQGLWDLQ